MTFIPSATKDFATYTPLATTPAVTTPAQAKGEAQPEDKPRRGIWRSLFAAIVRSRQRQADLEIARYLEMTGGKLTDSVERDIARHLSGRNYKLR